LGPIKGTTKFHALPELEILDIAPSGAPLDRAAGYPKLSRPRSRFWAVLNGKSEAIDDGAQPGVATLPVAGQWLLSACRITTCFFRRMV